MTIQRIELAPAISTSAYGDGDVVGGLLTLDVSRARGGAILNKLVLVDDDNEKANLELWLFNATPTSFNDNAVFAPTVDDLKKVITKVPVATADYQSVNSNAVAVITDINDVMAVVSGTAYGYLVVNGSTPTYAAATDLWLALDLVPEPRGRY